MSLFNLLFKKPAQIYPITTRRQSIANADTDSTETKIEISEYSDFSDLYSEPDLEPGDYYLKKIKHNMDDAIDIDIDIEVEVGKKQNIIVNNVNYLALVLNKYLYNEENNLDVLQVV